MTRRTDIRATFRAHPARLPTFGPSFWGRYPNWRWGWSGRRLNWWRWATWPSVTGWVAVNWSQPRYYNWGETVWYEGDSVYYDGQLLATADEFAQQAQQIAQSVPDVKPDAAEWLPLGVFALTQDDGEETGPDPTIFLQLAVSKEGIIAGTLQNKATDKAFEVEGTIDEKSQRAAWGRTGEDWPIMETGIVNLTADDAPALLHFSDGQTQQWLLVRLEEPQEAAGKAAPSP